MGRPKLTKTLEQTLADDFSYDPSSGVVYRHGKRFGTPDVRGYLVGTVAGKSVKVHRLAWFLHYKQWPQFGLDHVNRVKDDNRITNLRDVTQKVNVSNTGLRVNNKSGYKNVSWDKKRNLWVARKMVDGKYKFLGYYDCPTSAFLTLERV